MLSCACAHLSASNLQIYYVYSTPLLPPPSVQSLRNSPSSQRQRLQPQRRRLNITPESHHPNNNAHDIHDIVPIGRDIAMAATLDTPVFLGAQSAGEGLRYEWTPQFGI